MPWSQRKKTRKSRFPFALCFPPDRYGPTNCVGTPKHDHICNHISLPLGEPNVVGEARYLGRFVGGQRQSYGCMKYANGDTYSGQWLAGQKHGEGSYRFCSDGSLLTGYWVGGSLKRGRWLLPTGATYVGEFELNKPSGRGAWILPSGKQVLVDYTQQVLSLIHI